MLYSAQDCAWNAWDCKKGITNLLLVQPSVMGWNGQVRGLNKAVNSSEIVTLQVRIIEYLKLEVAHKDHWIQLPAPPGLLKLNYMTESIVQTVCEFWPWRLP